MKIVHLTESDLSGGAARGASRVHAALEQLGIDSLMVVGEKVSSDRHVLRAVSLLTKKVLQRLDSMPRKLLKTANPTHISPAWIGSSAWKVGNREKPDIFHLHWICKGYLRIERLGQLAAPIAWSLHDMWPFAGGEHYVGSCTRYKEGYRADNRPRSESGFDLNRWVWERKVRTWAAIPQLTLFPVSHWMAARARESVLFRDRPIEVVHNALDETEFTPHDHTMARQVLKLPIDRKLILFGALYATTDTRKGFDLLISALQRLRATGLEADLVVFGNSAASANDARDLGFRTHYLGVIDDPAKLSLVYGACDVMVVPSREEAFGQTAMEAMACGTPVVAFRVGGLPEAVEHRVSGYLAKPSDVDDLTAGISYIASADAREWSRLSVAARAKVEACFTLRVQAERCIKLYEQMLGAKRFNGGPNVARRSTSKPIQAEASLR